MGCHARFPRAPALGGALLAALALAPAARAQTAFTNPAPPVAITTTDPIVQSSVTRYEPLATDARSSADQALAQRVMDALANDPSLLGAAITVVVDEGRVRLVGSTVDADQARRALDDARDASGDAALVSGDGLRATGFAVEPAR